MPRDSWGGWSGCCWGLTTFNALIDALPGIGLQLGPAASLQLGMSVAAVMTMTAPVDGRQADHQVGGGRAALLAIFPSQDYG